jgi:hypothetical protein
VSTSLGRASLLVGVEGVALVLLGLVYGGAGLLGDPFDRTATLLEAALAVLVGGLAVGVARGLARAAGWSRSPAVVLQLLAFPVGVGLLQGRVWFAALPVLLLSAGVLLSLAAPQARAAFRPDA